MPARYTRHREETSSRASGCSSCWPSAQLTYLVSRRRRVQGWLLARDLLIAAAGTLFSLWVTFAAGYRA